MPLAYVLDENLRGLLWRHIRRHNFVSSCPIDVVRVADLPDLPEGTTDPDVLLWAERERRIIVSRDERTMPKHLADHLAAGNHSPGVFLARVAPLAQIVEFLVCAAYASDPMEWQDRCYFIP